MIFTAPPPSHWTVLVHCFRLLLTSSRGSSSSGKATPVRKISAHEFEKGGLTKPLVTTIDGTPSFLSPMLSPRVELTGKIRKKSRTDMMDFNEPDLVLELVKDICNELDVRTLCHKILQNVGILASADR
jgi:dual 3',5'-cyclic-AMP and -GMP phosphodiesterase 11